MIDHSFNGRITTERS